MGYGLLHVPSMSEVKQKRLSSEGFSPVEGVLKFEDIKFKYVLLLLMSLGLVFFASVNFAELFFWIKRRDKSKEKQRKQNLQAKKEKLEDKKRERDKKNSKKAVNASSATADSKKRKLTGKQRQTIQTAEDEEEMARDYRLLKKLKKGSIEEDDFAKLTGADDF